jgi:hypothetical protein
MFLASVWAMKWSASSRSRCSRRFIVTVGMTRTEHAVVVVAVVVRVVRPARQLSPVPVKAVERL